MSIYQLDKANFIEQHCENKDQPELKCNGKCHLSKQFIDPAETPVQQESLLFLPEIIMFVPQVITSLNYFTPSITSNFPYKSSTYYLVYHSAIDRPPQV